jgi:hypothetical protein
MNVSHEKDISNSNCKLIQLFLLFESIVLSYNKTKLVYLIFVILHGWLPKKNKNVLHEINARS